MFPPKKSAPSAPDLPKQGGLVISDQAKILDLTSFLLVYTTLDPQNGRFTISAPSAHTFFAFFCLQNTQNIKKIIAIQVNIIPQNFRGAELKIFAAPSAPLLYYLNANCMALPIGRSLVFYSTGDKCAPQARKF